MTSPVPDGTPQDRTRDVRPREGAGGGTRVRRTPVDRGRRPVLRGRLHENSAWYFAGTGTALCVSAFVLHGSSTLSWVTALYTLCLVGLFTVSALYHRAPWRSDATVQAWRRADHSMIAVFIAGTYGPVVVYSFDSWSSGMWVLPVCWVAAIAAVAMNIFWIGHPRWVDVVVYLVLGWVAVLRLPGFVEALPAVAGVLIVIGVWSTRPVPWSTGAGVPTRPTGGSGSTRSSTRRRSSPPRCTMWRSGCSSSGDGTAR